MTRRLSLRKVVMLLLVAGFLSLAAWYVYTMAALREVNVALAGLKSDDPAVRAAAEERLSRCTSAIAIRRIIDASGDEEADREALARALAKIGEPAIRPLIRAMSRGELRSWIDHAFSRLSVTYARREKLAVCATNALGGIGAPAVPELLRALQSNNRDTRIRAMWALGRIRDRRAFAALIAALSDNSPGIRSEAADALGDLADPRTVEALIAALKDWDGNVRGLAVGALGWIGDQRAVEPLIAALKDSEEIVRWRAAEALGDIGDPRALEPLIAALKDSDSNVRWHAAEALGKIGDPRAVEPLVLLLGDEFPYVAGWAAVSLEYIGGDTAKAAVDKFLGGRDLVSIAADYRTYIESGEHEYFGPLSIALERHGNLDMAADFCWSGHSELRNAASRWARVRGLTKELEASTDNKDRPKWKWLAE